MSGKAQLFGHYDSSRGDWRPVEVSEGGSLMIEPSFSKEGSTILDLSNISSNTVGYGYLDVSDYLYFGLQGQTSGTTPTDTLTVTIEASSQDDGTAMASCDYQDITSIFGVASYVDTNFFAVADTPLAIKYVRVRYSTSDATGNDTDLKVYAITMK